MVIWYNRLIDIQHNYDTAFIQAAITNLMKFQKPLNQDNYV